jgi:hypothetical protein
MRIVTAVVMTFVFLVLLLQDEGGHDSHSGHGRADHINNRRNTVHGTLHRLTQGSMESSPASHQRTS